MITSSISQRMQSSRASMAVRGISLSWGMHILKETQTAFTRGSRRSRCRLCIPPSLLKLGLVPAHSCSLTIETTRNFSWSSQENSDVPFLYIFGLEFLKEKKKKKNLCSDRMSMGKSHICPCQDQGRPEQLSGLCRFLLVLHYPMWRCHSLGASHQQYKT